MPFQIPRPQVGDTWVVTKATSGTRRVRIEFVISSVSSPDLAPAERALKSPEEIESIRLTQWTAHAAHTHGLEVIEPGRTSNRAVTENDPRPIDWVFFPKGAPLREANGRVKRDRNTKAVLTDGIACYGPPEVKSKLDEAAGSGSGSGSEVPLE